MGWEENATMNIRDKVLYERIKRCIYCDPKVEKTESFNQWHWFIDLAKFIGIRNTFEYEPGDVELNDEERHLITHLFKCGSRRSVLCYLFDWNDDVGSALMMVTGWREYPRGLLEYISKMCPEERYEVTITWDGDYDEDDPGYLESLLVNGEWFSDEEGINNELEYKRGMALAYEGKYEEAIETLTPLIGTRNDTIFCNIGVCYGKLNDYKKAKDFYLKSNNIDAKVNLLRLYDNKCIEFEKDIYVDCCNYLIDCDKQEGFLYLAYYYEDEKYGEQNIEKAIELIITGIEKCDEINGLLFEYAYLLETQNEFEDQHKAHAIYQMLLHVDFKVAKYNYALQCLQGRGCEENINEAIKWFKVAAEANYCDAIRKLIYIYRNEKGYKNKKLANMYARKLKELGGEE